MPTFDFTSPQGKTYSVTGPEGATREQAFEILQKQLGIDLQGQQSREPITIPGLGWKPSFIDLAKNLYEGVKAPGDILNANIAPQTPGVLTEEDAFRQNQFADAIRNRGTQMAGAVMTGALPGGLFGAPRGAIGQGFMPPGIPSGAPVAREAVSAALPDQALVDLAAQYGVSVPRYLAGTRSQQGMAAGLKNMGGLGEQLVEATAKTRNELGNAVQAAGEGFGSGNLVSAGSQAKEGLTNWIGPGSSAVAKRAYDSVDALIDPSITSSLSATQKAIAGIESKRANAMIPGESAAINVVKKAAQAPNGLNYQGVKDLRSYLGEMTPQEMAASGLKDAEIKQLYGALTEDLKAATAKAGGAEALQAFNRANDLFKTISVRREALTKIVGTKGDAAPEAVFARLVTMASNKSTADVARLMQARKAIGPEAWDEMAAAVIARLGRDPQGNFSLDRFLGPNGYNGLSPAGKQVLFRSTGKESLGKSLDDIARISEQINAKLKEFANPSGTAKALTAVAGVIGIVHHPILTLATYLGSNRLAQLLAEPAAARGIAEWSKAYRDAIVAPHKGSARQVRVASERLADTIAPLVGAPRAALAAQLTTAGTAQPRDAGL